MSTESAVFEYDMTLQDDIEYKMTGGEDDNKYFYLNPVSGVISTKKFLTETKQKEFRVCIPDQSSEPH